MTEFAAVPDWEGLLGAGIIQSKALKMESRGRKKAALRSFSSTVEDIARLLFTHKQKYIHFFFLMCLIALAIFSI